MVPSAYWRSGGARQLQVCWVQFASPRPGKLKANARIEVATLCLSVCETESFLLRHSQ